MANKRLRGKSWHYIIRRKNLLPKPINLTFDDEAEGDKYVAHLERLLDAGIVPDEFKKEAKDKITTIADAIDNYIEIVHVPDSDQAVLKVVRDRVGSRSLSRVNYAWAEEYVKGMKTMNLSPSTIRHHVGSLSRCLDWVEKREDTAMLSNPLRKLPKRYASGHKEEVLREERLAPEHEKEMLHLLDGGKPKDKERSFDPKYLAENKILFLITLGSGMVIAEIYTLTEDQVDIPRRTIFLDKTKNGDSRQVPMTSVLAEALTNYVPKPEWGGDMFPWASEKSPRLTPQQVTGKLSEKFSRMFKAAGCEKFTFHCLRHEATSRLYERTNLSDVQIAKILGWKSLKMALRYANLRASNLADSLW